MMLRIILALIFAAPFSDYPLPPDLPNVRDCGCIVAEHSVRETLNAKTKELETTFMYRVEPYVYYKDGRRWQLPKELVLYSNEERPGAIADTMTAGSAADLCVEWMNYVKRVQKKQKVNVQPKENTL